MRVPRGEFRLDQAFVARYMNKQPDWGPLGYLTFKRTYAADLADGTSEEFWQTCQRVIEGMFQILAGHCHNAHLPWSTEKAQVMAQEAYERMFAFKWLPPGRGLAKMGTDIMFKVGGACLNNCFSGDTEILVKEDDGLRSIKLRDCIEREFVEAVLPGQRTTKANVQSFGIQQLQRVTLTPNVDLSTHKNPLHLSYDVTPDHRWLLADGSSTTKLDVGDKILVTPEKREGRAFDVIGYDDYYAYLYESAAAATNVIGKLNRGTTEYQRGFLEGVLDAGWESGQDLHVIQLENKNLLDWVIQHAPSFGYCVIESFEVETIGKKKWNRLVLTESQVVYQVASVIPGEKEEVFCPVVPDENKFTLSGGVVTGNCGFTSTKNIGSPDLPDSFSAPFCWLMDMSMLGVGVGFDTKGAGKRRIRKPVHSVLFVVEDSRQGWVDYLRDLLESYVNPDVPKPIADYSKIRPKGAKIKGFGGTSSGPEALVKLTLRIEYLLDNLIGEFVRSSTIVDIANAVGECVVSGGVRRTAEIGFGDPSDVEFLRLKDYENNPEARELPRWASNNSVMINGKDVDYDFLAGFTVQNGEPGYLFLENARRYGRMIDPENHADMHAEGANPCVTRDTLVLTSEGPKTVAALIDKPFNAVVDGKEYESTSKGFFNTGVQPVYHLVTHEGYSVKVTGNHKILEASSLTRKKRNTKWTEARDLNPGDLIVLNNLRLGDGKSYNWKGEGAFEEGWLVGSLLGDGHFYENTAKLEYWGEEKEQLLAFACSAIPKDPKRSDLRGYHIKDRDMVSVESVYVARLCETYGVNRDKSLDDARILGTSAAFQRGFLAGLFDADGSVQGSQQKGVSVRLGLVDRQHLAVAQKMLLNLGVASTIYENRQMAGPRDLPGGTYDCHAAHELVISEDNLQQYQAQVSFKTHQKQSKLNGLLDAYVRTPNRERFVASVKSLTYLGVEHVYDCTIPEKHAFDANGVIVHNCNEQTLWDRELCCLVENFPANCEGYEDFERTLKFSYLYAKTVTLVPTHDPQTNAVMTKNRRIGSSQSGIWDNVFKIGIKPHIKWCDAGYKAICAIDDEYSNWLGVPKSIKKTSVKPSGTLSKLVGCREGIHKSKGEYEIQSIRINDNSPLIQRLLDANIRVEKAVMEPNTVVAYFPMHWPGQSERPATMWEQLEMAAIMQAYWADNQVSITVDFDQETEGPSLGLALAMYSSRVKGLSFLPRSAEEHYVQLPKRVCTKEEYEEYKQSIRQPDFTNLYTHEVDDLYCDGGVCALPDLKQPAE